ncbi:MAG: chromosomal replication initiator protein DnaA [Actinobacteria bacterium]|nr:MAG: chromosomal replication initiator protein DnaA [Actinomycetota bacterium]
MARPARVRIRRRNPWVFLRRRLFGWNVRLDIASILFGGERQLPCAGEVYGLPPRRTKGPHPEKVRQKAPSNESGGKVRCYSPRRFTSGHLAGSQARDRSPSPKVSTVGERPCGLGMAVISFEEAAERTWARVVERARDQLPESSFSMWFVGVRATSLHDGVLEVTAPSDYVRDWLAKHYLDLIQGAATDFVGQPVRVQLGAEREPERGLIAQAQAQAPAPERQARTESERGARELPFPNFTFETFVAGPSNRFAHAAAMAVAEAPPSKAYNPLFIYGGVGLGKTHLLVAIAHHMHRLAPRFRVKYVTSESFMAEFIKAVRERQGYQFAARHRDIDVLLVDDIQFLAKREETQTEFFHTFNALHEKERQIVIASDRPPQELGMEERLQSRFRLGLCVDVQPPDLETRIAILQLKAQRESVHFPDEVIEFVASKFDQNIRELEGALVRVVAWSDLTGQPISQELVEHALEDLLPQAEAEIPPQVILDETARYYGLSVADLVSKSRSRPLTNARHVAMYLIRETTGMTLPKIGELFDRDHTTALHGINKIDKNMRDREPVYRQVQDLSRIIRNRTRAL